MNNIQLPPSTMNDALVFLKLMYPEGPWCLTAIDPNGKGINAETFYPETDADCIAFINRYNGNRNLYWHVNPVLKAINKKATRKDIKEVCYLHVDIDPGTQGTLQSEQDAILEMLTDKLPKDVPEPTTVIFSGGGFQAFWKLKEPISINGDIKLAEDSKLYNIQLENQFGADNCHNIDRLMRLPGTMNIPDERKRKKGRVEALATVTIPPSVDRVYGLDQFSKAPVEGVQKAKSHATSSGPADEPLSFENLSKKLNPDWLHYLCTGECPQVLLDNKQAKNGDSSRSGMFLSLCCALMAARLTDDQCFSALTDKENRISQLSAEKGAKWVHKTIEKARLSVGYPAPRIKLAKPLGTARLFCECKHPHLIRYLEEFLTYDNGCYKALTDDTVKSALTLWLETCEHWPKGAEQWVPVNPTNRMISEVMGMLKSYVHVPAEDFDMPCWRVEHDDKGFPPEHSIVCTNKLVNVMTGAVGSLSPMFLTRNVIPCDFDPGARAPVWEQTLGQWFPGQEQDVATIQEFAGLCLVQDMSFHKALMIEGPKRSGKGTMVRVLKQLIGSRNVASPNLAAFGKEFGLQPLIGKLVFICADARIKSGRNSSELSENFLRIVGGDGVDVNRKGLPIMTDVVLRCRGIITTNELPQFHDDTGTIASRFLPIRMHKSFIGKEDRSLEGRLQKELPGILNWCMVGVRRLVERGHFDLSAEAKRTLAELEVLASPLIGWVDECCLLDVENFSTTADLYNDYKDWCASNGHQAFAKNTFGGKLKSISGVRHGKPTISGKRTSGYYGIKLRPMSCMVNQSAMLGDAVEDCDRWHDDHRRSH